MENPGNDSDSDSENKKGREKKGRRKIKIEFIDDKSKRHITFSKRKAGIMKKVSQFPIKKTDPSGVRTCYVDGNSSIVACSF